MTRPPEDLAFRRFLETRDPAAMGEVFDHTAPRLLLLAAHLAGAGDEPEDLLQATFLTAIGSADRYDPRQPVQPWLMGILANQARAARRRGRRTVDGHRFATGRGAAGDEPTLEAAADREFCAAFDRALDELSPPHRRLLVLHLVHGLSSTQIARAEGCPPATIKSRLRRATEQLRRCLPAGFAAALPLAISADAMAAVRAGVVAHATRTVAAATGGAALTTGVLMMKKTTVPILLLLLGLAVWIALPADGAGDPAGKPAGPAQEVAARTADRPAAHRELLGTGTPRPTPSGSTAGRGLLLVTVTWRSDGLPAAGVPVIVRRDTRTYPSNVEHVGVTDPGGRVQIDGVAAGTRVVTTTGSPTTGDADPVAVRATIAPHGSTEVRLQLDRTGEIRGLVVDAAGAPVLGAHIHTSLDLQEPIGGDSGVRSEADGTFAVPTWTRWLTVHARMPGQAPSDTVQVEVSAPEPAPVRLVVGGRVGAVRGTVRYQGEPPPAPARVWLYPGAVRQEPGRSVQDAPRFAAARAGRVDRDGCFEFHDVPPGRFVVRVLAEPYGVHRVTAAVEADATAQVDVLLLPGATLSGAVRDHAGRPLPGVTVYACGLYRGSSRVAETGTDGTYALDCLPAGSFEVVAFDNLHARVHAELAGKAGEAMVWNPVLAGAGIIRGRVVDAAGHPLPGWTVRRRLGKQPVTTDGEGRFELTAPLGRYHEIHVFPTATAAAPRAVVRRVLADGDEVLVRIDPATEPSARLTGRLSGPDRRPAPHPQLEIRNRQTGWTTRVTSFADDGRFEVGPLAPGEYSLGAEADGYPKAEVGRCTLDPGRLTDAGDLSLAQAVPVELRLRHVDGSRPRDTVHVAVLDAEGRYLSRGQARLATGVIDLPLLPPGTFRIQVGGPDVLWTERKIELTAGRPHREEVLLRPGVSFHVGFALDRPVDGPTRVQGFDAGGEKLFDVLAYESLTRFGMDVGLPVGRCRITATTRDGRSGEAWCTATGPGRVVVPIR